MRDSTGSLSLLIAVSNTMCCTLINQVVRSLTTRGSVDRKQLQEKYERPGNCPRFSVSTCNPEVFRKAQKLIKTNDIHLQDIQKDLIKGIQASAY